MEMKVAIVDNSIDSSIYNPIIHWKSYLEVEWEAFKAIKSHFPDLKKGYTHLILTGSEASILEREKWVYEEVELIQEAAERDLSILGSCYGHQLIAFTICGPSCIKRCAYPEVGWIPILIKENNNFLGNKKRAFSFSSHFDEVVNLGNDFDILASSKNCQIQAFRLKNRPVWGLQIHPEINVREGQMFLKKLISLKLKTTPYFEEALKQRPKDSRLIRHIIKKFLGFQGELSLTN